MFLPKLIKEITLLIFPFLLIWGLIYWWSPIHSNTVSGLSPVLEKKLGDKIMELIYHKENRLTDPALDSVINGIRERFKLEEDSTTSPIKIVVMESSQVNAFALPGGNIVILSGLIDFCDHPEELAGVLAHEIGHVKERHVLKNLTQQLGLAVLTSLIFNKNAELVNELVRKIIGSGFSRDYEQSADAFAMDLMNKNQVDPQHLADFLLRMELKYGGPSPDLGFLASHPSNGDRIKEMEEFRKTHFKSEKPLEFPSWERAKAKAKSSSQNSGLF